MPKLPLKAKNLLIALSLVVVVVAIVPNIAEAQAEAITKGIIAVLWSVVVGFFGKLVGLAGILLNTAIGTFVVGFGDLYESTGLGFSIDNLWSTVRDIFNLTFIFGLVFIGFKMIFNSSDSNARRMLGSLILAALLVNFSLFITKFIIDFSNIAATQLAGGFMKAPGVYAVSDGFVNLTGLTGIWGTGPNIQDMTSGSAFAYVFGSLILYLVTAFVFAAGGILLIIRFVVLNIYMVLSPLMFLGWVFPGFSNVSREYWRGFMSRAFFAPAYILMLYFAHQILVNMKDVTVEKGALAKAFLSASPADAQAGFISTIPYFIITSVFLIAAIVVAQKMGAVGATNVMAIGNRMTGKVKQYATNKAVNTAIRTRDAATYAVRAPSRVLTNKAGSWAQSKLDNAQASKGWGGAILRTNTADRVLRGAATSATKAEFGTGTTNKAEKEYKQKTESRAKNTASTNDALELARLKKLHDLGPLSAEDAAKFSLLQPREVELQAHVAGMSTSAIEEMGDADRKALADMFSNSQLENINKSDKISDQGKAAVAEARREAINKIIGTSGAFITDELNKLSINQIETLGEKWLADNSHVLSDSQMDEVKKSKKFTEAQKNTFSNKRKSEYKTLAAATLLTPPVKDQFKQVMEGKKPKDIAKLPADLLMSPGAMQYLSAAVLREIATNGSLDSDQQKTLETSISLSSPGAAHPSAAGYFSSTHAKNNWG